MGRVVLVKSIRFLVVNEIQEADSCTKVRFEPNSQQKVYSLVVSHNQQSQCLHRLSSAVGFNRNFHARQDPHSENISDSDFQSPFMAKATLKFGDGSMSSVRYVAIEP